MPPNRLITILFFLAITVTVVVILSVVIFSLFPQIEVLLKSKNDGMNVIVVGGGLAGLSAAIEATRHGSNVVIIDKEKTLGGNSAKATSGINGVQSFAQKAKDIEDSVEMFVKDTLASGGGLSNPELVRILATNSAEAIDFLHSYGIGISDVVQLGGHSVARTHRIPPGPDGRPIPVGFTIVSTLRKYIETKLQGNVRVLVESRFAGLIIENNRVVGIKYKSTDEEEHELHGNVVLTAGGFANDHNKDSLLEKYVPELSKLPTTNGPWATGDILKATVADNLSLVHMNKVQIHPTGFIETSNPNLHTKFLAPEALRGCGAILLNANGERFVNELGRRDHVTKEIFDKCGHFENNDTLPIVAIMLYNDEIINRFGAGAAGFYKMKGIIKDVGDLDELAAHLKVSAISLTKMIDSYRNAAEAGEDEFGKVTFPVVLKVKDHFYLSYITPTLHYCMGGLKINEKAAVLREVADAGESPLHGLFAAGEVTGGVHGENRLGGNSLLECVVFGRIAGYHASHAQPAPGSV